MSTTANTPTGPTRSRGRGRTFARLWSTAAGRFSLIAVGAIVALAIIGPWVSPYGGATAHLDAVFQRPGTQGFWLGTDNLGRDILTRTLYALRSSLATAALAVALTLSVGLPLGLAAGTWRLADAIIARFTDIVLAFPSLIVAVGLASIARPGVTTVAVALGLSQVPKIVRVVRVETMRIRGLDFVTSAIVQGAGTGRIMLRYVLPNSLAALIVQVTVMIPVVILGEAGLSFLGLGIQPPAPSLGVMLAEAQQYYMVSLSAAIIPGVVLAGICFAFNAFGDRLRDASDIHTY